MKKEITLKVKPGKWGELAKVAEDIRARVVYCAPGTEASRFGGEGTGGVHALSAGIPLHGGHEIFPARRKVRHVVMQIEYRV